MVPIWIISVAGLVIVYILLDDLKHHLVDKPEHHNKTLGYAFCALAAGLIIGAPAMVYWERFIP